MILPSLVGLKSHEKLADANLTVYMTEVTDIMYRSGTMLKPAFVMLSIYLVIPRVLLWRIILWSHY